MECSGIESTKFAISFEEDEVVPWFVELSQYVGDEHLSVLGDKSKLTLHTIPTSLIHGSVGTPNENVETKISKDIASTVGCHNAIFAVFLGSEMGQVEYVMVAQECEIIKICRNENLASSVLDTLLASDRVDELVVVPVVGRDEVVQFVDDFVISGTLKLRVAQFGTQLVVLIQLLNSWSWEVLFFFHLILLLFKQLLIFTMQRYE